MPRSDPNAIEQAHRLLSAAIRGHLDEAPAAPDEILPTNVGDILTGRASMPAENHIWLKKRHLKERDKIKRDRDAMIRRTWSVLQSAQLFCQQDDHVINTLRKNAQKKSNNPGLKDLKPDSKTEPTSFTPQFAEAYQKFKQQFEIAAEYFKEHEIEFKSRLKMQQYILQDALDHALNEMLPAGESMTLRKKNQLMMLLQSIETEFNSRFAPVRPTLQNIFLLTEDVKGNKYYMVDIHRPQTKRLSVQEHDPEDSIRTKCSQSRTDDGIANFLSTETYVFKESQSGRLSCVSDDHSYRSASPSSFKCKDKFDRELMAVENVRQTIFNMALHVHETMYPNLGHDAEHPIPINQLELSLQSPIALNGWVDGLNHRETRQVKEHFEALQQCAGRTLALTVNGKGGSPQTLYVKVENQCAFNLPVNVVRDFDFSGLSQKYNARATLKLISLLRITLHEKGFSNLSRYLTFYAEDQDTYTEIRKNLDGQYEELDNIRETYYQHRKTYQAAKARYEAQKATNKKTPSRDIDANRAYTEFANSKKIFLTSKSDYLKKKKGILENEDQLFDIDQKNLALFLAQWDVDRGMIKRACLQHNGEHKGLMQATHDTLTYLLDHWYGKGNKARFKRALTVAGADLDAFNKEGSDYKTLYDHQYQLPSSLNALAPHLEGASSDYSEDQPEPAWVVKKNCKSGEDRTGMDDLENKARIAFCGIYGRPADFKNKTDVARLRVLAHRIHDHGAALITTDKNAFGAIGMKSKEIDLPRSDEYKFKHDVYRDKRLSSLHKHIYDTVMPEHRNALLLGLVVGVIIPLSIYFAIPVLLNLTLISMGVYFASKLIHSYNSKNGLNLKEKLMSFRKYAFKFSVGAAISALVGVSFMINPILGAVVAGCVLLLAFIRRKLFMRKRTKADEKKVLFFEEIDSRIQNDKGVDRELQFERANDMIKRFNGSRSSLSDEGYENFPLLSRHASSQSLSSSSSATRTEPNEAEADSLLAIVRGNDREAPGEVRETSLLDEGTGLEILHKEGVSSDYEALEVHGLSADDIRTCEDLAQRLIDAHLAGWTKGFDISGEPAAMVEAMYIEVCARLKVDSGAGISDTLVSYDVTLNGENPSNAGYQARIDKRLVALESASAEASSVPKATAK